ncbi:hypothetical protein MLD38_007635 [Melastoma candidum]|uniref:Uncharacterized protein n=1 Tax=Melastoma candidum TaxID=119954 RepID=A0ACB9RVH4_9MYRT|nr:hypothetical protein MLD38_007635 [Melastoma candidum]
MMRKSSPGSPAGPLADLLHQVHPPIPPLQTHGRPQRRVVPATPLQDSGSVGDPLSANAGLKRLGARVLGKELEKLKIISYSNWDREVLSEAQVEYIGSLRKMNKLFAITIAAAIVCLFTVDRSEGVGAMMPGGIRDCRGDQNDAEIQSLARFAVDQHNEKENSLLEFGRVLKAREQVVAGMMYYLTLEAIDAGKKKIYEAKVWVKPWMNFKQLQEFKHSVDGLALTSSDLEGQHADAGK